MESRLNGSKPNYTKIYSRLGLTCVSLCHMGLLFANFNSNHLIHFCKLSSQVQIASLNKVFNLSDSDVFVGLQFSDFDNVTLV